MGQVPKAETLRNKKIFKLKATMTYEQIANEFQISRQRAQQIVKKMEKKLSTAKAS